MTIPYFEVEYYKFLITGEDCEDSEYQILLEDEEVKSFLEGKNNAAIDYEAMIEEEDFPENMEGRTFNVWQIVLAAMEGDYRIFDFPEVIPNSTFANAITAYAAGFSNDEYFISTIFQYIEDYCDGEWGPLLVGIAVSGDQHTLEYLYDVHIGDYADTIYYQEWVTLAKKLTWSREVALYLETI